MTPRERQAKILEMLRNRGYVSIDDLSNAVHVSTMTIRRDLDQLQAMALISRHYGGAALAPSEHKSLRRHGLDPLAGASLAPAQYDQEWPWPLREKVNFEAKEKIGRTAASFVKDDDVILMDAGTTTYQVARHLTQKGLTVISNFLPILSLLSDRDNTTLIGIGGVLDKDNQWFTGPTVADALRRMNANLAIMATTCLSITRGLTNRKIGDSEIKRAMIETAERTILVMDSSKMNRHTLATVGPLQMIDTLVTDAGISLEDREAIKAAGVQVVIAE